MSGWIPRLALYAGLFVIGLIAGRLLIPAHPAQTSEETVSDRSADSAVANRADPAPMSDFSQVLDRLDDRIADLNPPSKTNDEELQRLISDSFADEPDPVRAEWLEKLEGMSLGDAEFLLEQRRVAFGDSTPLIMQTSFESTDESGATSKVSDEP